NDGVMRSGGKGRYIEFVLRNGWRYEEKGTPGSPTDYIRLGFKEYKRQFDISNFGLQQRTADSVNKNSAPMYSMRQLGVAIDSLKKLNDKVGNRVQSDVFGTVMFVRYLDSNLTKRPAKDVKTFNALVPDSINAVINQKVSIKLSSLRLSADAEAAMYKEDQRNLRIHKIEWHRKLSMAMACLVLFLIGAPLGSIIRKGGLGSPLIFAIIFFILFYFISTTGEKVSREGTTSASIGMWLSTMILTPIGIFLIYKAMRDSQLFNKEFYFRLTRKIRTWFRNKNA
ncbi:MAG TPA: LptF/LptG family permease, partial [Flavisolibacter sp.]|nr:LptF/LptG family permease [Flavisolibacter sp.]